MLGWFFLSALTCDQTAQTPRILNGKLYMGHAATKNQGNPTVWRGRKRVVTRAGEYGLHLFQQCWVYMGPGTTDRNTRFTWVLGCKTKQIPESFPDIRYSSTKGRKTYPNFPKFPSRMPSNFQYEIQHRQQPPPFLVSERYFTNFRSTPPSSGNVPNKRVSHFWPSSSGVKVWWDNPQPLKAWFRSLDIWTSLVQVTSGSTTLFRPRKIQLSSAQPEVSAEGKKSWLTQTLGFWLRKISIWTICILQN